MVLGPHVIVFCKQLMQVPRSSKNPECFGCIHTQVRSAWTLIQNCTPHCIIEQPRKFQALLITVHCLCPAVVPADISAMAAAHQQGFESPTGQRSEGPSPATVPPSSPATGAAAATGNALAAYKRAASASASPGPRHNGLPSSAPQLHSQVALHPELVAHRLAVLHLLGRMVCTSLASHCGMCR